MEENGVLRQTREEGEGRGPSPSKGTWLLRPEGPVGQSALRSVMYTHSHTLHIPVVLCQHLGKPGLCGFGRAGTNNPQTWARAGLGLVGRDLGVPQGVTSVLDHRVQVLEFSCYSLR